jgi:hypothetical protein
MISSLYNFRPNCCTRLETLTVPQYIIHISEPVFSIMDICATTISQNVRDRLPTRATTASYSSNLQSRCPTRYKQSLYLSFSRVYNFCSDADMTGVMACKWVRICTVFYNTEAI